MSNFYDYLNAMQQRAIPESAYHAIEGSDTTILSKVYTLVNPKGKKETLTITDSDVIRSVEALQNNASAKEYLSYFECAEYARLYNKRDVLKAMGFKDVGEFAAHMFGKQRVTINQYVRIGRFFLTEDNEGRPVPSAVFPHMIPVSSMLEMLAYAFDETKDAIDLNKVISWYSDGLLVDGMSAKKIRAALKGKYAALEEGKQEEGKQEGKQEEGKQSKQGKQGKQDSAQVNQDEVSFINQLDSMSRDVAANTALQALEVVYSIFEKFEVNPSTIEGNTALEVIDSLKNVARSMLD